MSNSHSIDPTIGARESTALESALVQSQDVKVRVQACAADIGTTNNIVKQTLAEGETQVAADVALSNSERVEADVRGCADDLHGVNATLARGVAALEHTEKALARSRTALAQTELELRDARKDEQAARYEALHDKLTGMPNRAHFDTRLEQAMASAKRHGLTLAVMFFDIDGFKQINDVHGHAVGDGVLREVASRLAQQCREEDAVCRNGGDEFLCFLMNPKGDPNIRRVAQQMVMKVREPIELGNLTLSVDVSIGISVYPKNGATGEHLIQDADAAMYSAKRNAACGWMLSETAQFDEAIS
jgi:diguanylate cyclase (GGDEF)-like protein